MLGESDPTRRRGYVPTPGEVSEVGQPDRTPNGVVGGLFDAAMRMQQAGIPDTSDRIAALSLAENRADQAERQRYIDAGTPNRQTARDRQRSEAKRANTQRPGADPSRARVRNEETTRAMISAIQGSAAEAGRLSGITREIMEAKRAGRTPYGDAIQARARAMIGYGGFLG